MGGGCAIVFEEVGGEGRQFREGSGACERRAEGLGRVLGGARERLGDARDSSWRCSGEPLEVLGRVSEALGRTPGGARENHGDAG